MRFFLAIRIPSVSFALCASLVLLFLSAQASPVPDPLAELVALESSLRSEAPSAGGSVRAKGDPEEAAVSKEVRSGKGVLLVATVLELRPAKVGGLAIIRAKVLTPPTGKRVGTALRMGQVVWIVPRVKAAGGRIDRNDPLSRIVSRTGQLSAGDTVMARLVEGSGELWYADFVERK